MSSGGALLDYISIFSKIRCSLTYLHIQKSDIICESSLIWNIHKLCPIFSGPPPPNIRFFGVILDPSPLKSDIIYARSLLKSPNPFMERNEKGKNNHQYLINSAIVVQQSQVPRNIRSSSCETRQRFLGPKLCNFLPFMTSGSRDSSCREEHQ